MVKGDAINIKPKYQRRERWNRTKQSALIESFLMNIPVPPIYLAEDEYGMYSVIDGKQRITSIYNFIELEQKLVDLEKFKEIEGFSFHELPTPLHNALKIRPYIRVITLLKQSDSILKYEVFNRLNTGGDKLLPQEIRNAAFEGKLNDLMVELSENDFFRKQFNTETEKSREKSKIYKEMIDVEYVLRFFTLRETWENFSGNMRIAMDSYMEKHYKEKTFDFNLHRKTFNETVNMCSVIWGNKAFKRPDGRNEIIQGVYDVQTVATSLFIESHKKELIEKRALILEEFEHKYHEDSEFQISMRQFTSNIKQVKYRIGTMVELIQNVIS